MARVALVLGAGGVVGQGFHAGFLAALEQVTGFDPRAADLVVGTSAGSVAAASLRAGLGAGDLFARATGRPLSPEGRELFSALPSPAAAPPAPAGGSRLGPASPRLLGRFAARPTATRPSLALAALLPEGRRETGPWFAGFDQLFKDGRWPEAETAICAVALDEGRLVAFGRPGSPPATVAQAVQASCAIPAVFRPCVIGGVRYVDGGIHSPTNADLAVGGGFDAVVVSSPMTCERPRGASAGQWVLAGARYASRLPAARALARELRRLAAEGTPVLVAEPTAEVVEEMGLQPMDPRRRAPVAEATLAAATRLLDGPLGVEIARILRRRR